MMALVVWLVSIVPLVLGSSGHSNPSLVDCLWSLQPWAYCWHFLLSSWEPSARLVLMTGLATLWGVRLTYNFYIKGGFSGGEDYRWKEVNQKCTRTVTVATCHYWGPSSASSPMHRICDDFSHFQCLVSADDEVPSSSLFHATVVCTSVSSAPTAHQLSSCAGPDMVPGMEIRSLQSNFHFHVSCSSSSPPTCPAHSAVIAHLLVQMDFSTPKLTI